MPKQRITEIDNTGVTLSFVGLNTVYIPGGTSSASKTKPVLYTSYAKFLEDADVQVKNYADDKSFKMAKRLLQLGLPVLYQAFPFTETRYAEGVFSTTINYEEKEVEGSETGETYIVRSFSINGENFVIGESHLPSPANESNTVCKVTKNGQQIVYTKSADIINGTADLGVITSTTFHQYLTFDFGSGIIYYTVRKTAVGTNISMTDDDWKELLDRNLYDIRFVTSGGHPEVTSAIMVCLAAKRGDAVALIDHTADINTVDAVREYMESIANSVGQTSIIVEFPTKSAEENLNMCRSFGAGFTPWFTAKFEDVNEEFPASFGYLLAFARSVASNNPIWMATAGSFRGVIPELTDVNVKYTNADCEKLGARAATGEVDLDKPGDNVGLAINPIAFRRPFGYLIWGDRTMRENDGSLKATSQLHSRVLCSELNKAMYTAANKFTFEQNNDILWINFKAEVNPLLEQMKSGEGIGDYKWTKLATNKRARISAKVAITPIDAVEDFDLAIYMENSIDVTE